MINSRYPMFCAWGPKLAFLYNDGYIPIFGAKHPHTLGLPFRDVWSEIWHDLAPMIDSALAGQPTYHENLYLLMERNGYPEDTWYSFSYSPVRDERGEVAGMFCACTETTQEVLAKRQTSNERERLFAMSQDLIGTASFKGMLTSVNPAWSHLLGRSEQDLLATPFADFIHPDDLATTADVLATLQSGQPVNQFYVRLIKADGTPVAFAWSAIPDNTPGSQLFYTVGRNITEEVRRDDALRQTQKLEAVGQLTGGLAHDFNNLLQVVHGNLDLIRRQPGDPARVERLATNALLAADRGSKLTAQLLAFSRAQKLELRPAAIKPLIVAMSDMIGRSIGPGVRLSIDPGSDDLGAMVDSTQLEMALLNLAINARDAMPGGGALSIKASAIDLTDDPELPDGRFVEIAVSDEGVGMTPDVAERAFDPFFTTKDIGKGTGLGLSQVYAMARQAGGTARLEPGDGYGLVVRLLLKLVEPERDQSVGAGLVHSAAGDRARTVLVVDDDSGVRQFLADSLAGLGFKVAAAEDGNSALEMIESADPDLLLVDFAMPGMNGAEVANRARVTRPDLPIIFATGYADTALIEAAVGTSAMIIKKPFNVAELEQALLDVLADASAGDHLANEKAVGEAP